MRAAQSALPYEHPKLAIVATGRDFAASIKEIARARGRSNAIDAKANYKASALAGPPPELDAEGKMPPTGPGFTRRI
jgi:hypothetical protein